jgi:hypothetical protein
VLPQVLSAAGWRVAAPVDTLHDFIAPRDSQKAPRVVK